MIYPDLFKSRYPDLQGKNWLRFVSRDDRKAFAELGRKAADEKLDGTLCRIGGQARATNAVRDALGKYWNRRSLTRTYHPLDVLGRVYFSAHQSVVAEKGSLSSTDSYACIFDHSRSEFKRWAWREKWPNYCPKCEGKGGIAYRDDPSPRGISLSSGWMEFYEPCPNCIEKGCCPRCGEQAWLASDWDNYDESIGVTCPFCLWNDLLAQRHDSEQKGYVIPVLSQCSCKDM